MIKFEICSEKSNRLRRNYKN